MENDNKGEQCSYCGYCQHYPRTNSRKRPVKKVYVCGNPECPEGATGLYGMSQLFYEAYGWTP